MPKNPIAIKTIVATPMAEKIAKHYGVELKNVPVGFKYIGKALAGLEQKHEQERFIFGFEESHGYLAGSYICDKDGVFAAMLICEMVLFYRENYSKTLVDVLNDLYEQFGYYKSFIQSYLLKGKDGMDNMLKIMDYFRNCEIKLIGNFKVLAKLDYFFSKKYDLVKGTVNLINLPKSNVLEFELENNLKILIRVSGTEPKLKIYYHSVGKNSTVAARLEKSMREAVSSLVEKFSNK